jgi:iron complex transport system permease protein
MRGKPGRAPNYRLRFLLLALLFVGAFCSAFLLGRYPVTPWELVRILLGQVLDIPRTWDGAAETAVLRLRLPRAIAAALIGAALSAAGAAYQGMFRNPMVSPDVLGASAGAGFGAALAIFCYWGYFGVCLASFAGGLTAVLLAYGVSRFSRGNATLGMVLAGMMIGSLFSSATSYIKLIADTDSVLPAITYWLMGSLSDIRWRDVRFAGALIAVGLIPLLLLRWRINLLTLGEDEARSMGIDTTRLRTVVIVCATLITAASVSVSGLIGWVGLVIPHFCRILFGHDYRRVLPASVLMGGAFLLIVDDFARLLAASEVPLGILTSVVGAPVFLWLIVTGGRRNEA